MTCLRCQAANPPGARFCGQCAAPLAGLCPSCGATNAPDNKFCGRCAAALDQPARPRFAAPESYTPQYLAEKILTSRVALEGERKQVTVLFADLKGSMELLADRDPEEARRILDPVLERMMEAVHHYEGTVNQVMGDGIMALFGAPLAHEDHAVRACYAALRMQESVKQYGDAVRREEGVLPQIRVGLNSGEVVVRSIGSDLHLDYTAVGETTHLAARVEQAATPASVLITGATLQLAEGYVQVTALGPVKVKGLGKAVEVYELTGAGPARSRFQMLAGRGLTRFVGREGEIERLDAALAQSRAGRGQVVAIVGEPGVGKSRLVWQFTHSSRMQGCLAVEAASVSYGTATSYLPVIEWLRAYFQLEGRDDPRRVREKVTGKLLSLDRALEPSLPALLTLLEVPVDDEEWKRLEPSERRQRTLDGVRRLLLRESQVQPLVVVCEDLHWIDSATQAVLDGLVESLPGARLLLLVTYRPEYQHGWSSKTYYTQQRVDPLAWTTATELLQALLGGDASLDGLKRLLIERTEGNPLFLEESARTLVETNTLAGESGAYRLAEPIHATQIPASVHAVLAARIDRLPLEAKHLLQAAAVIGHDVPLALLRAVAGQTEPDLRRSLAQLQAAEFLYETSLFPDLEYTFKHALTHEVTYGTLLQLRRRELHARIVEAIERLYADRLANHVERLAHHALRGEVWEKAVTYLREAGRRAATRSAYRESLTSFEEALRALGHLPESREVTTLAIDIRLDSRVALVPLGQYDRILDSMREAETLARELGDRRRLGLVLADMGARLRNVGEHRRAVEASQQAVDVASGLGDPDLQIEAKYRLAQAHFALGDLRQATSIFLETVQALANRSVASEPLAGASVPHLEALPGFFEAWPHAWLALVFSHLGQFGRALEHAEQAMQIAERTNHPHTLIESHGALGGVSLEQGDLDTAQRVFERGVVLLRACRVGDANLLSGLGHAYALSGRLAEALPLLEESVRSEGSISAMGSGLAVRMSRLAEAHLRAGRADEALRYARTAVELSRKHQERANEAMALRVLAEIAAIGDPRDPARAREQYADSLALAEELGLRPLVAHCHRGLGKLCQRIGAPHEAREHLTVALTMYREMDMRFWPQQAEAEMNRSA
jgi:class 3 adenylate cyclase/tetratricopeptide (TPR) repeat protein